MQQDDQVMETNENVVISAGDSNDEKCVLMDNIKNELSIDCDDYNVETIRHDNDILLGSSLSNGNFSLSIHCS